MSHSQLSAKEPGAYAPQSYPYLIIRHAPAVYQREEVRLEDGKPAVGLGHQACCLQFASPFDGDGAIPEAPKHLLVWAIQQAAVQTFRDICIVWAKNQCTYISREGLDEENAFPPDGGVYLNTDILDQVCLVGGVQ